MDCVVNEKYKYMMFYGAKAACSSLRTLYLEIHKDEFSREQLDQLDSYHNLNEVHNYQPQRDYRGFYKFYLSRNPYSRAVSAYLDQYAFAKNEGVLKMFERCPPKGKQPQSFIEVLEYIAEVPDELRDVHFQTQSYFEHAKVLPSTSWFSRPRGDEVALNYHGDIGQFNHHLEAVYKKIFRSDKKFKNFALAEIHRLPKLNNVLYGEETWDDAANLTDQFLRDLVYMPKPQDFFSVSRARELVESIYQQDFEMFAYTVGDIPNKKASPELKYLPADFDWKEYALLNPDLAEQNLDNERELTRHYLMHGREEARKRFYKLEAPDGFDWQNYLQLNQDLVVAGINSEQEALLHFLQFGYNEKRRFKQ